GVVAEVARPGLWNALARTLVHLTAPGVPDLYQGDELWTCTLTDPDNRRPVDYAQRETLLADLEHRTPDAALAAELVERPEDGRIKLHVVRTALALRREHPEIFRGGYQSLAAGGGGATHVFAFVRRGARRVAVTIVPRLTVTLVGDPTGTPLG